MRVTHDRSTDVAYIYLAERIGRGGVASTYACDPSEVDGQIHLDFDASGILVGIEILNASHTLPAEVLKRV
ncbi:MAG: DUF2283 domain-containing protein [Actinomycetota bacterium]